MFTDLFSSLDGCSSIWSWAAPLIVSSLFFTNFTWVSSSGSSFKDALSSFIESKKELSPLYLFLLSIMFFLVSANLIGLGPFVFGPTSALWLAGSLALTMWGLLILSGWVWAPMKSAAHLAPSGAPAGLLPLLVLIETVSLLIRPLTLTVRLIANISAGHIVLSLVANCLTGLSFFYGLSILTISVGYTLFEVFVCFIQAYIFTLLVSLYAQEHP
uniref:ATP synthase subunit a n=1 Tax=Trimusculus reticulatus TaxID=981059 RepID=G8HTG0_9EUPU|nr:ATP synthase F0 subunit 6 [Trimusculus reticulatus]AEQ93942.1 ATP synthase subunit 6 [Trimusculus reticulatus]